MNMSEAAGLRSVAMDLNGFVLHRSMHETWHDHSVLPSLARANCVEKPHNNDRKPSFLKVCKSEKFVKSFCTGVCPSMLIGRPGQQIVIFLERNRGALPVNFGGARDQHTLSITRTKSEDDIGAAKNSLDRAHRTLHDQLDADGTGHVVDTIGLADELFHQPFIKDRVDDQAKSLGIFQMCDVRIS